MAKKKTTKKKAKKKVAKKRTARKPKGAEKAANALAKLAGADTCLLCNRAFRSLAALEEHVYKEHGGITREEYLKLFPSAKNTGVTVAEDVISMDEMYRAMTHMAKYGEYPDWYDGHRSVDIAAADSAIVRAFASVIIRTHQDRILGVLRYITIALRREFNMEHALTASDDEVQARATRGMAIMKESMESMHESVDLLKKVELLGKEQPSYNGRMFIAAQIESGDSGQEEQKEKNRFQHQVTALTGELHGLVQSFMSEGTEHGEEVPSQVVDVEVEEVK